LLGYLCLTASISGELQEYLRYSSRPGHLDI
jgi:hypothetical protein